jgi:hypothetical protein
VTTPRTSWSARAAAALTSRRLPYGLAVLAALLLAPSLGIGLVVDDYVIRAVEMGYAPDLTKPMTPFDAFRFGDGTNVRSLIDQGAIPWWASPGFKLAFFRPLASASHWLDHRLFPGSAAAMHAVSIAWVVATVVVACALYRRLLGPGWPAGLAALFFAVDPGHAVAGGWIATRNAVLAAFFGLGALYAHDRWRRDGDRWAGVAAPVLTGLSLASGESGAATLGLLFAYVVVYEGPGIGARLRALAPAAGVAALWAGAYKGLGCGTAHSAMYADPLGSPVAYLRKAALGVPVNLGARLGGPPAAIATFFSERALVGLALVGVGLVVAMALALGPLRRTPAVRFLALAALLTTLPIAGTLPSDRNLFFVGFAALGLAALVVQRAAEGGSRFVRGYAGWLVLIEGALAALSGPANATSMSLFAKLSRDPLSRVLLDEGARGAVAVFVNPPAPFFVATLGPMRAGTPLPMPSAVRALAPGVYPMRLKREREDQVTIHVDGGLLPRPGTWPLAGGSAPPFKPEYVAQHLSSFARSAEEPFAKGDVVTMPGVRVEVLSVTAEGGPTDVRFTFDRPLDDPKLRWLAWKDEAYVPFTLPPVGGEVSLPAAQIRP